jgi:hypothetical protein
MERETNKWKPAREGKGTAQLKRLEVGSVVEASAPRSSRRCCAVDLTADQRPSEHRPTDDEDNRSGQVDPAETYRLDPNKMTKRAKTPTPTIGADPWFGRPGSGQGYSPLRSGEPAVLGEVLRYCLAIAMRRRSSGSMKWS